MTKVQRNAIFRAVVAGGLDPSECEFGYQGNSAHLRHDASESTFSVGGDNHGHYMSFVKVGDNKQKTYTTGDWDNVLSYIMQWASEAKRYVEIDAEIPDL